MTTAHQSFLTQFDDARKPLVEAMLQAIDEECPDLTKIIKWNAPSFCDDGKDRLTVMLHKKDRVGLILHTGAKPKEDKKAQRLYEDSTRLLEWNSNIRATILFVDMTDFLSKRSLFKKAVKQWIDETKNL
jgi:uncharacterized protein YdhG (YjbR/CyaY superfamily)